MHPIALTLLLSAGLASVARAEQPARAVGFLYVGTYSPKDGEGILRGAFDPRDGSLGTLRPTGGLRNTAAFALHPTGKFLYATTLIAEPKGKPVGGVAAFAVDDRTGELREIDRRPSGGTGPCFLSVDQEGKCVLVAKCGTATVASLALRPNGRFGDASTVIPHRGVSRNSEQKPQAHSIIVAPGSRFAIAVDLGLDRLFVYRLDAAHARLTPHDPPFTDVTQGAGPRHFAFHPGGEFAYSINELGNTITACAFDTKTGVLRTLGDATTLPGDFRRESYAADLQIHPNGKYLYGTNRGHDSIAIFGVDTKTGRLRSLGHTPSGGKFPRSLALDPTGSFLVVANQKSDNLVLFRIDPVSGSLRAAATSIAAPQPVCVRWATRQ